MVDFLLEIIKYQKFLAVPNRLESLHPCTVFQITVPAISFFPEGSQRSAALATELPLFLPISHQPRKVTVFSSLKRKKYVNPSIKHPTLSETNKM